MGGVGLETQPYVENSVRRALQKPRGARYSGGLVDRSIERSFVFPYRVPNGPPVNSLGQTARRDRSEATGSGVGAARAALLGRLSSPPLCAPRGVASAAAVGGRPAISHSGCRATATENCAIVGVRRPIIVQRMRENRREALCRRVARKRPRGRRLPTPVTSCRFPDRCERSGRCKASAGRLARATTRPGSGLPGRLRPRRRGGGPYTHPLGPARRG
jgi:hypothetical protein